MQHIATGVMSGTSLDGLDLAHCIFEEQAGRWTHRLLHATTVPYPAEWSVRLRQAVGLTGTELVRLHQDYGRFIGRCLVDFFNNHRIGPGGIIASHGHTVFHRPDLGYTLQIGSGASIAAETGRTVVCDFRSLDVALNGQGAPLVPVGDKLLFKDFPYCLNLGGFANISFDHKGKRQAFDICPVNFVMNRLVAGANAAGPGYDAEGRIAESGKPDQSLLDKLNRLAYYAQTGPKSLGAEWVDLHIQPLLVQSGLPLKDLLSTWVEHTAAMISRALPAGSAGRMLATGGGVHNAYLVKRIRAHLPGSIQLHIPDPLTTDFKEALVFAFLGVLRLLGRNNVLASVTGSRTDHSGGIVFNPQESFAY